MARVKRGVNVGKKHKKILKLAKGYRGARSRSFKRAHEAVLHAGEYAFAGRKQKKRQTRTLWINRINSALKQLGLSYREFTHNLKKQKVILNRKILADLVINDMATFHKIVKEVSQSSQKPNTK